MVTERVWRLEEHKIITGYTPQVSAEKFGRHVTAFILMEPK